MKIKFIGDREREVAPAGRDSFTVVPGAIVEADDELSESLLAQPRWWAAVEEQPESDEERTAEQ